MRSRDTHARSIAKTVVWRVLATLGTWGVIYFFTGKPIESLGMTLVAAVVGMVAYYIHERIWDTISWGKRHH